MASTTTKRRSFLSGQTKGKTTAYVGSNVATTTTVDNQLLGYEVCISEGHQWPPPKRKVTVDSGGGFTVQKAYYKSSPWTGVITNGPLGGPWYKYEGDIHAYVGSFAANSTHIVAPSSNSVLDAFGARAISAVIPTKPQSNMGQFMGEMRDIPSIPRVKEWRNIAHNFFRGYASKKRVSERAASEWLNLQFGWIPFVSELLKFGQTVTNAERLMQQFDRDSGRNVRRKFSLPSDTFTSTTPLGDAYGVPVLVSPLNVSPGKRTQTFTYNRRRWFTGCFTYYVPPSGVDSWSQQRRARQMLAYLYGVRATPDLIWSLAPWSWAVDWVSNAGSVIRNYSAFSNDNLVMRYGYVMEHTMAETTTTLTGARHSGGRTVSCSMSFIQETKTRRRATPYGFGLNTASFSAKQWSIIAALGISLKPRAL